MKKIIFLLMAISLVALAVPALAQVEDCDLSFTVDVTKTVTVDKTVTIDKDFDFDVYADINVNAFAECDTFKCDYNYFGLVTSYFGTYTDTICESFTGFTGIGQANQASGFINNQGNIVAAAVVSSERKVAAMTETAVEQTNYLSYLSSDYDLSTDSICSSFNDFTGIGQANQSAGHLNNQNNVVALSAGLGDDENGVVATNDTYLTQNNTLALVNALYPINSNSICSSFNNFTGIGQVNQSAGSANNQANIVSIAYTGPRP